MRIATFSPGHVQTRDLVDRWGIGEARQWLGVDQPDPMMKGQLDEVGQPIRMCRCAGALAEVIKAGGHQGHLCGSSETRGYCPYHPNSGGDVCGVFRQHGEAETGAVQNWNFAHTNLAHPIPKPMVRWGFSAAAIDEGFWSAMLGGFGTPCKIAAQLVRNSWSAGPWAIPDHPGEREGWAGEVVEHVCRLIANAIHDTSETGRLRRSSFIDPGKPMVGFTFAALLRSAHGYVWRAKIDPTDLITPGMSERAAKAKLKKIIEHNNRVQKTSKLLELMLLTMSGNGDGSPYIRVIEDKIDTPEGEVLVDYFHMKWRTPIHDDWLKLPTLCADATMRPEITRVWLPDLDIGVPAETAKVPEGVRLRQLEDRAVSYTMIRPDQNASEETQKTQRNNCAKIARHIEVKVHQYRGAGGAGIDTAVMMPKATEEEVLRSFTPTEASGIGHFGNIRGFDGWKEVGYEGVYGRPAISPAAAEDIAWVIFGEVGLSLNGEDYPKRPVGRLMADGTGRPAQQVYHPDPQVEAVRWSTTEGEMIQDIARGRHVWRDVAHPLAIDIGTNVCLPIPMHELISWDQLMAEGGPVELMVARGIVPADWVGTAALLNFPTPNAARQWFNDNPTAAAARNELLNSAEIPMEDSLIGISALFAWSAFSYRRQGERKGSTLLARSDLADPRAVAEKYLGPLDRWEPAGTAEKKPPRKTITPDIAAAPKEIATMTVAAVAPQVAPRPVKVPSAPVVRDYLLGAPGTPYVAPAPEAQPAGRAEIVERRGQGGAIRRIMVFSSAVVHLDVPLYAPQPNTPPEQPGIVRAVGAVRPIMPNVPVGPSYDQILEQVTGGLLADDADRAEALRRWHAAELPAQAMLAALGAGR
ncbi:hypothetical protein [Magnetospirillum fulvum]|uniref:Uncharacterized protein n=1 Tax=Magnetospirillum fulvum MGU-K5 TaxID=1316936 RepID=S9SBF0_MAGFU|nr:hypothetical protein [Magnetospirillum fulvum]EPY03227.1 hypothetical protein K678_01251 [Magnetospirillum fulvum MGU-K5]